MILVRAGTPAQAASAAAGARTPAAGGSGAVGFSADAAHGSIALSHSAVLAPGEQHVFAEVRLSADASEQRKARSPLSLAVAVDTSGSMGGDKILQARKAILQLIGDMRDDDEIALVRFASDSEVLQPMARVGDVRAGLVAKVQALSADGGTAIPGALSSALSALAGASAGRVRRIVLASDGLDSGKAAAEKISVDSFKRGVVVSALGIGLDFDEGYLSAVSQAGHGNFGFVKEGSELAGFLRRELDEGATTTVQAAEVRLRLPAGVAFVRAAGADAAVEGNVVTLKLGALFAGDERRAIVELTTRLQPGDRRSIEAVAAWKVVGGAAAQATIQTKEMVATGSSSDVSAGVDGAVLASATSALVSVRQLSAVEAYNKGDEATAQALIDQNLAELSAVRAQAPAAAASALSAQASSYAETKATFKSSSAGSPKAKMAAKKAMAREVSNLSRKSY
jgi:Ca-activated chloride channel homolog